MMDLFGNLPRDVAIDILSRLPIPSIFNCKAVSREWRDLIKCREFGNGHQQCHLVVFPRTEAFPTSKPYIWPRPYKIEELKRYSMGLSIVHMGLVESVPLVRSSVNGLILLLRREWEEERRQRVVLWLCNPITREYVLIPNPSDLDFELGLPYPPELRHPIMDQPFKSPPGHGAPPQEYGNYNFGFGVSTSGQYKVVWISQSECRVYTLGMTGEWRTVPVSGLGLRYNKWNTECELVGGNLYWLDPPESPTQTEISCFDLETEAFTYFSAPPPRGDLLYLSYGSFYNCYRSLCRLDERLCLCDSYGGRDIEIWLMQRRGDWSKKLVIGEVLGVRGMSSKCFLFPIKVLEDDNWNEMLLGTRTYPYIYYYSSNEYGGRRIRQLYPSVASYNLYDHPRAAIYTPSFLPLKTLLMDVDEDVRSF